MRASCIFLVHPTHTHYVLNYILTGTPLSFVSSEAHKYVTGTSSLFSFTSFIFYLPSRRLLLLGLSTVQMVCYVQYIVLYDYTTPFSYRNGCNSCHNITFYIMWSPRLAWYKSVRSTKVAKTVLVSSPHQTFSFIAHKHEPSHFSSSYLLHI